MLSLLTTLWPILVAASSSDDEVSGLMYVGIALICAGPIFYFVMYARYRNKGERHYHERETPVQMSNLMVFDNFVNCDRGTKSSRISGANDSVVAGSLAAQAKQAKKLKGN